MIDNDDFVTMMRLAQEDPSIRETLVGLLSLDPENRKAALTTLIDDMKFQHAPKDFIQAISIFLNDEAAEKALTMLQENESGCG